MVVNSQIPPKPSVLIVGAGPTGLVAALTLCQNGIPVRIIEKMTSHLDGPRGAIMQPRSLELFNLLGILEDIQNQASDLRRVRSYSYGGTELLKEWDIWPWIEPTPSQPYSIGLHIGQDLTEGVLRAHLARFACHVELGTELKSFEQFEDHVDAEIQAAGGSEKIAVSFLLGADGAHSIVRKQLGFDFVGDAETKERFVIGEMHIRGLSMKVSLFVTFTSGESIFVILRPARKTGTLFSYNVFGKDVDHARLASDRGALMNTIHDAIGSRRDIFFDEILTTTDSYQPKTRMARRFGDGRAMIAGDAAHIHSPTGGQGLNSSIQDALNLSWKLSLILKNDLPVPNSLLGSYTAERVPVIAEMLSQTTVLLENTSGAKPGDVNAWKRSDALRQLGVNYRGSPIVLDGRTTGDITGGGPYSNDDDRICAGDRAPDAPGLIDFSGQETRLFDFLNSHSHSTLVFGEPPVSVYAELERLLPKYASQCLFILPKGGSFSGMDFNREGKVVLDRDGHGFSGYAIRGEGLTFVVIRPDGVIGAITFGVEGIEQYFKQIHDTRETGTTATPVHV